jgi:hypothetical protein
MGLILLICAEKLLKQLLSGPEPEEES